MRIIFLGTNGWYNTDTGNTSCVLVETASCWGIFDAGDGVHKADRYITDTRPVYLFISHLHLDHVAGLHTLDKLRLSQGLTLCAEKGLLGELQSIMRSPFTVPFERINYPVTTVALEEGGFEIPGGRVQCRQLRHSSMCFGYRLEADDVSCAYCADTGPCDNALLLAKDVDMLISECSLLPGETSDDWPHMSPEMAAECAQKAGARQLILTHFNPAVYPTLNKRQSAGACAQKIFPDTIIAKDNMEIVI